MNELQKTIETYLQEKAAETIADDAPVVADDNKITVHYVGRLAEGEVFDTSVEMIAKAAGKYTPQRDYTKGLPFTVGAGQMIAGFDKWVVGMKLGETKTIEIPAKDAYGERDEKKIQQVEKTHLPPNPSWYKVWDQLHSAYWLVTITKIDEKSVRIDFNHNLAGKDLIFDITVIAIE